MRGDIVLVYPKEADIRAELAIFMSVAKISPKRVDREDKKIIIDGENRELFTPDVVENLKEAGIAVKIEE
jgi:hypothetical protein